MIFGMDYREPTETVGAGQLTPIQFDKGIPMYAIALWTFVMTGTAAVNGIGGTGISRYQDSVDSELVIDITPSETRALFEYIYSRMGGAVPAAADVDWVFPFYLLGLLAPLIDKGNYPEVGYVAGSDKVHRIVPDPGGTIAVGSARIGWKKSSKPVTHSPLILGRVLSGMTLSTADNQYLINWQPLPTVGIIINGFTSFVRMRIYAADKNGMTTELCDVLNAQVLAVLQPYSAQSITNPIFIPFDVPTVFAKDSYILFETAAGYAGTERIVPVQLVPETVAAAA